jgi:hypothetical protein
MNTFRFCLTGRRFGSILELNTFKLNAVSESEDGMYIAMSFIYLAVTLALTVWVARTLERNGRVLLADAFPDNAELANAVKRLLLFGFYLINVGYMTWTVNMTPYQENARAEVERVTDKVGGALVVLGIAYFVVLSAFQRLRKQTRERHGQPRAAQGPGGWIPESAPLGKVLE